MTDVYVYKADGTRQCEGGHGTTLEEAKAELARTIGEGEILEAFDIAMFVIQVCGAPTGHYHVCKITEAGWATLSTGIVGPLGWQLWLLKEDPHAMKVNAQNLLVARIDDGPEVPFPLMPRTGELDELPLLPDNLHQPGLDPAILEVIRKLTSAHSTPTIIKELLGYELRVIRPGDSVTLDLRTRRVNISVDNDGYIVGISFH